MYVVRELTQKRVWFAEPLLSSTNDEVRRVLARARQFAEALGIPVAGWVSDKQEAFVQGIAEEFPGVPHRYCDNHFLRDLAKTLLEKDGHAKVQMRRKVRGLRTIEQAVLREEAKNAVFPEPPVTAAPPTAWNDETSPGPVAVTVTADTPTPDEPVATAGVAGVAEHAASEPSPAGQVVWDYCAVVRGILNDDQGGPLHPPGLRMAAALVDVRESLTRNLRAKKGGSRSSHCSV